LLRDGVSIATVELDFIALSVWHKSVKAGIPGLRLHDPAKQDAVRVFIKHLLREVRLPAKVTVPLAFQEFVKMINSLDRNKPKELFARIVFMIYGFGGLRRVAAENLFIKRKDPALFSVDFVEGSDVYMCYTPEYGWEVALLINIDKNIPAGRWRWIWIPGIMKCGLSLGDDLHKWLTEFPVPDGPLLAAPTGPKATGFYKTRFKGIDRLLAKHHSSCFPDAASQKKKIAPYSLRKMTIQTLKDYMLEDGTVSEADVGEFIGWVSTKTTVMKHYAGMSRERMLYILSSLDPTTLPQEVQTAGVGPF
jgi:hypothetical protein